MQRTKPLVERLIFRFFLRLLLLSEKVITHSDDSLSQLVKSLSYRWGYLILAGEPLFLLAWEHLLPWSIGLIIRLLSWSLEWCARLRVNHLTVHQSLMKNTVHLVRVILKHLSQAHSGLNGLV